jgi:hypothetical protein
VFQWIGVPVVGRVGCENPAEPLALMMARVAGDVPDRLLRLEGEDLWD